MWSVQRTARRVLKTNLPYSGLRSKFSPPSYLSSTFGFPSHLQTHSARSGGLAWTPSRSYDRRSWDAEQVALSDPSNAYKASLFYKSLNADHHWSDVITHFESKTLAHDEACGREYITALWRTGQLDRTSYRALLAGGQGNQPRFQETEQQTGMYSAPVMGMDTQNPLHVEIVAPPLTGMQKIIHNKWGSLFINAALLILIGASAYYILTQAGSGGVLEVLQKQAYREVEEVDQTFDDVKGCSEVKKELQEVVAFLKDPDKFARLGGRMPKGLLLIGPSGTGKTLVAKAVAGEAGVPFLFCSGSDFEEQYVGLGAKRIRELFATAKKKAPCIIFMDEIDAIGGKRSDQGRSEMRASLNQLLVEMDGFDTSTGVILIAATNFIKVLDSALLRPGRFDRQIMVPLPDLKGREEILDLYVSQITTKGEINTNILARATTGSSGAELYNIVNSAALYAATNQKDYVVMKDLEYARDKIQMGAERKSAVIDPADLRHTAYHEGGHAIVNLFTEGTYPIHKATIMPRGQALGMVHQVPEHDQHTYTHKELLAYMDVCMGGRVAEELIFGHDRVTTGASNDLQQATAAAKSMVLSFGMGERTGLHYIGEGEGYLETLAPETKTAIDMDVQEILQASYTRVQNKLSTHRDDLEILAQALLKYETLDADEIKMVMAGQALNR